MLAGVREGLGKRWCPRWALKGRQDFKGQKGKEEVTTQINHTIKSKQGIQIQGTTGNTLGRSVNWYICKRQLSSTYTKACKHSHSLIQQFKLRVHLLKKNHDTLYHVHSVHTQKKCLFNVGKIIMAWGKRSSSMDFTTTSFIIVKCQQVVKYYLRKMEYSEALPIM